MIIREVMTRDVRIASPDDTLEAAARRMEEEDFGSLPIAENDRLVGMLTDRDITIRAVARGLVPRESLVREVMSPEIKYVYEDESVSDVALTKPASAGDALQSIAEAPARATA